MTTARYQVALISCVTGQTLAEFDGISFFDLRYSRVLNGVGRIAMTLPSNNPYRNLFTVDSFIEVYRTDPTSTISALILEETYLLRLTHRYREDNDEWFAIGGVSLNDLMRRRIVNPADDPSGGGASGYSTKAGAADTVIRNYCLQQMGASASALRQVPGLTILPVAGTGIPVGARLRFENLLEQMQDLAQKGGTDFIIQRGAGAAVTLAIAPIGSDKTQATNYPWNSWVGLNPQRGNLQRPSLQVDRTDEKTYVYAMGEGQGANRQVFNLIGDSATDSPFNFIEFTNDVRNIQKGDATGLLTGARIAIRDNLPQTTFTFEPTGLEPGNTYRQDWDIGDRVTVTWDNFSQTVRFTEIEIGVSGDSGETIKPTVVRYDE